MGTRSPEEGTGIDACHVGPRHMSIVTDARDAFDIMRECPLTERQEEKKGKKKRGRKRRVAGRGEWTG